MIKRKHPTLSGSPRGFSLIEVMLSIVVLATGMLALAALQAKITRNGADAKNRSYAVMAATDVLERSRRDAESDATTYRNLGNLARQNWTSEYNVGTPTTGATFQFRRDVVRFVDETDPGICGAANAPCFRGATPADNYGKTPEFKRITTTVFWTDDTGVERSIALSDVVSSTTRDKSASVLSQPRTGDTGGGPVVLQPIPSDRGVIPIAIGDSRETAATNPKPILDTASDTLGTRFEVLTYAVDGANAEIQRRVENEIISCKCRFGAPPTGTDAVFTTKLRPTFWTGQRYSPPLTVEEAGVTGVPNAWSAPLVVSGGSRVPPQNPLCDDCCRDHHDPAGVDVKFDPRRDQHVHFSRDSFGALREATDGDYVEACRFVRVDGVLRVASDFRMEHMNLLETTDLARNPEPSDAGIDNYQEFVTDFLEARVFPLGGDNVVDAAALEEQNALNLPERVDIETAAAEKRFLHNRSLYLDHLEPDTVTFLRERLGECSSDRLTCLLPFLPFVTVNATEIALYAPDADDLFVASGGGQFGQSVGDPRRGVVRPTANSRAGEQAVAGVLMRRSNTGLTSSPGVDPADAAETLTDAQDFMFAGAADTDGDGIPNTTDPDDDNDGVDDTGDNCPLDSNAGQLNTDRGFTGGDALGDACDDDDDADTVPDARPDNCPVTQNLDQADGDRDGIGDVCDQGQSDTDGDTVVDSLDNCPTIPNTDQTDVLPAPNGNGIGDDCEGNVQFTTTLAAPYALDSGNPPLVGWALSSTGTATNCQEDYSQSRNDTNPNPYGCIVAGSSGTGVYLAVGRYNRQDSVSIDNPCRNGGRADQVVCYNYRVSSVTVGGSANGVVIGFGTPAGKLGEETRVQLPALASGASIQVQLTSDTPATTSATFVSCNGTTPVFSFSDCN
jgi:type IV pilus modification protein PilV